MISLDGLGRFTSIISFVVGLPTTVGTYYQVWRTRRETKEAREGLVYSQNCLEFIMNDGRFVNLVPLETLHSLPKPGDIVLLPGAAATPGAEEVAYGAYRVSRIEHIYARVEGMGRRETLPGQARLAKAVAHVELLSGTAAEVTGITGTFAR
jgi:hypothetical protein